jgi:hypothetical protein
MGRCCISRRQGAVNQGAYNEEPGLDAMPFGSYTAMTQSGSVSEKGIGPGSETSKYELSRDNSRGRRGRKNTTGASE